MKKTFKILMGTLILFNIVLLGIVSYMLLDDSNNNIMEAERINIKDKSGSNRVIISNMDHIPPPIISGKAYKRAVHPAGIIFYDKKGDERGGIAITDTEETNFNALAFDYQNADAVGLFAQDNKNDNYFKAGLIINDKDHSKKVGHNTNRINLLTENGNASLVIKDGNEVPRIVLKVDSLGKSSIEMFDMEGKSTWQQ